jgi:fatty acid desaturase
MARTREINGGQMLPSRGNVGLGAFHLSANVFQFFLLPLCLLPVNAAWGWTLLPLAFLNNPFWSLIHEAIHDLFHPSPRVNTLFGRAAAVQFGAPFRILRSSHLLHHKLNRTPMEATELYDAGKCSRRRAAAGYYFQILGGLYLLEFLTSLLFFLPRAWIDRIKRRYIASHSVSGILMQNWTTREAIREIRVDGALVLGWVGLSLWCYGASWPLLLILVAARGFLISFLDNIYHYRTPVNDIFYASNLRLPAPLAGLLLNFNLHGTHHRNPAAPWSRLPALFRDRADVYHGGYFSAAARQLCGPVAIENSPPGRPAALR